MRCDPCTQCIWKVVTFLPVFFLPELKLELILHLIIMFTIESYYESVYMDTWRELTLYYAGCYLRTCLLAMASGSFIRASGFQNSLVRIGKWIFFRASRFQNPLVRNVCYILKTWVFFSLISYYFKTILVLFFLTATVIETNICQTMNLVHTNQL